MTDDRLDALLGSFYRDTALAPPDPELGLREVMTRVRQTRQRRRWWPLPVLDRPVSTFPSRGLAPAPIPATDGRQPARGFTMLSAVRFVVAGAIVALFGGFLLTVILTTQQGDEALPAAVTESPSPVTTDELLAGMATKEVEPRVYRVINDGVRDLAKANNLDIVAGHDGGIWLLRPQRFLRLGSDEWLAWATEKTGVGDFEVAPDGTVWSIHVAMEGIAAIQSFDGDGWTTHHEAKGTDTLEVTPDGTVWATWLGPPEQEDPQIFGYLDEDGWQALGHLDGVFSLHVASAADIWATAAYIEQFATHAYRFVDGAWLRLVSLEGAEAAWQPAEDPAPDDAVRFRLTEGIGPDGTFWGVSRADGLVRFDGRGWSRWSLRDSGFVPRFWAPLGVAPDASVWFALGGGPDSGSDTPCDGVGHFDGVTWDRYLPDLCVDAIDITADGEVWLLAGKGSQNEDGGPRRVYVITPEAVVASE